MRAFSPLELVLFALCSLSLLRFGYERRKQFLRSPIDLAARFLGKSVTYTICTAESPKKRKT